VTVGIPPDDPWTGALGHAGEFLLCLYSLDALFTDPYLMAGFLRETIGLNKKC